MGDFDLAQLDEIDGLQKYDDKVFDAAASSSSYLPRLQLMTANSGKCKSGEFPMNHYAVVRDQTFQDVGGNVDVLVLAWRPKAIEMGEAVITSYDPNEEIFQKIQAKAAESDSGCMFGIEFLMWVASVKQFATFFMGTKSSRRESPNVKARLRQAATLGSQKIETKKYTWYGPTCTDCSTPFEMPSKEDLVSAVEKFNNPPKNEVEVVDDEEETGRAV